MVMYEACIAIKSRYMRHLNLDSLYFHRFSNGY